MATIPNTHITVANVPLPLPLSEIAEAPKTYDFCQTVFATIVEKPDPFFINGEDGFLRRHHPSITKKMKIVALSLFVRGSST